MNWRIIIIANFSDLESSPGMTILIQHVMIIKNWSRGTFPVGLVVTVVYHHATRFILILEVSSLLSPDLLSSSDDGRSATPGYEA